MVIVSWEMFGFRGIQPPTHWSPNLKINVDHFRGIYSAYHPEELSRGQSARLYLLAPLIHLKPNLLRMELSQNSILDQDVSM